MISEAALAEPIHSNALPIPVGVYARVSTDGQIGFRFDSCDHQAGVCREIISKNKPIGWFEAGFYRDEAYSGATLERPGLQQLMRDIAAGRIKIVLVYKIERILRSTSGWARFQEFLGEHGCQLLSANEDLSDTTASGRLKSNILVSFAEYERLNTAEKTRSKMLAQAKRGMWGGGFIPFGYSYDRESQSLKVCADESGVVRRIFEQAAALHPLSRIVRELNAEGYRTGLRWKRNALRERQPIGQRLFRPEVVASIIRNPLYRGVVRFGGEEFTGQHEALVSSDRWEQANAAITEAKRKQGPRLRDRDKYSNMLKGIVYCAAGGTALFSGASVKGGAANVVYRYYTCSRRGVSSHDCVLGSVAAKSLEIVVVGFLAKMATDTKTLKALSALSSETAVARVRAEMTEVNGAITGLDRKIGNCVDAVAAEGAKSIKPELIQRIDQFRKERQQILVQRVRLQQEQSALEKQAFDHERIRHAAERLGRILPKLSKGEQAQLVRAILVRADVDVIQHGSTCQRERHLKICLHIRVDRLVAAMERDVVIDDRTLREEPFAGRCVEIETRVVLRPKGWVEIVAPFCFELGERSERQGPIKLHPKSAEHPIHRATRWQNRYVGMGVRSIAAKEKVSPSLVSLHLKLLRLAPEIQIFSRELTSPQAIRHFSLRRLAALAMGDQDRQLAQFATLRATFGDRMGNPN
jgi:DNA invertase Pin-like site-specific DNA recombinase